MKKSIVVTLVLLLMMSLVLTGFAYPLMAERKAEVEGKEYGPKRMLMGGGFRGMPSPISVLSDLTGLSIEEIRELRSQGQSLADIAKAKDISTEKFVEAVLAAKAERLEGMVAQGVITQEAADEKLSLIKEHIEDMIERDDPCTPGESMQRKGFKGGFKGEMSKEMGMGMKMRGR
ncbi:MAG: hypothetical protein AB1420_02560 [Bacillota bacterium]